MVKEPNPAWRSLIQRDRGHYDREGFKELQNYGSVHDSLHNISHELETIGKELGIQFILLHGSLVGQITMKSVLPWDLDMDVSLKWEELQILKNFSHEYNKRSKIFKISFNTNFINRWHQANSAIDARLIDTNNGVYVDITGLTKTALVNPNNHEKELLKFTYPNEEEYKEEIDDKEGSRGPVTVQCKRVHMFYEDDIWPPVLAEFEGAFLYRPKRPCKVLRGLYPTLFLKKWKSSRNKWYISRSIKVPCHNRKKKQPDQKWYLSAHSVGYVLNKDKKV